MLKESATGIRAAAVREMQSRPKNRKERGKAEETNRGSEGDKRRQKKPEGNGGLELPMPTFT